ncbi:MAG: glycosyl transferase [Bacteroidales bacterium]|jgi:mannosyltransferase OCH1-like enzyme|nr:glycosyl transferase [Bacteroidales bacterium]
MIPKIIHYCWFGRNPLPESAKRCIASWKKYFSGYEIKQWDESNYNVYVIPYTSEAYKAKKYAFVSDYARFDILHRYGGIYFDTDVEVIRAFDPILEASSFAGVEDPGRINPGLGIGAVPGLPILHKLLDRYCGMHFINADNTLNPTTIVDLTTEIFTSYNFTNEDIIQTIADVTVYPKEYFNPLEYDTYTIKITPNTYSIHHGNASWFSPLQTMSTKLHIIICRIFGLRTGKKISKIINKIIKFIYRSFVHRWVSRHG